MSLLGEERKKIIVERVNAEGQINTLTLAEEMGVSSETIRKYLDELEKQNKLKKVYGGAVQVSLYKEELPIMLREIAHLSEKQLIAQKASTLIEDNDVIIVDEGSSAYKLVEFIVHKKNLTIVTPSLSILSYLVDMQLKGLFDGKIIFIGGTVSSLHGRVTGSIAEEFISQIYAQKAFVSTEGISMDGGVTDFDADKSLLSRKFIQNAEMKYVLCDHSKIEKRSFYRICKIDELTGIICDTAPPPNWMKYIKKSKVSWIDPSQD